MSDFKVGDWVTELGYSDRSAYEVVARTAKLIDSAPADTCIRRVHAGVHQRSMGAWSWFLHSPSDMSHSIHWIGSQWPASMIARCEAPVDSSSTVHDDAHLDPCEECLAVVRRRYAADLGGELPIPDHV